MARGGGFNLSTWAIEHQPLVRYLMVVLLLGGLFAFDRLGQDEDPPFTFRTMVVRAYWPGATATQMAEQVTDKLEKKLQEVPGLEKLRSYSKPGETLIFVQLKESMRGHDVVDAWYQVRKKVSDIRGTLPSNVQGPFFNDEFGDVYGVMYAFSSDGFTYRELKDHVEAVRQQLLRVPNVAKVDLFGVQDEKIYIEISDKKLAQVGLDIAQLAAQIGAQNAVEGAGVLVLPTDNLQVRVSGEFRSLDDLRQLPIRSNGLTYKLADIATVNRAYTDPPRDRMRAGRAGVPGARGDRARRLDGQGRRHHPARQGPRSDRATPGALAAGRHRHGQGGRPAARGCHVRSTTSCASSSKHWSWCLACRSSASACTRGHCGSIPGRAWSCWQRSRWCWR